jgi:hypothetical protein
VDEGVWLSILEYSNFRGISVSTIRRYIKSSRVKFKKEDGKYLIYVSRERYDQKTITKVDKVDNKIYEEEFNLLKNELRILKEENEDLKMLVHLYEFKNKDENGDMDGQPMANVQNNNETRPQI